MYICLVGGVAESATQMSTAPSLSSAAQQAGKFWQVSSWFGAAAAGGVRQPAQPATNHRSAARAESAAAKPWAAAEPAADG